MATVNNPLYFLPKLIIISVITLLQTSTCNANDILGCGGFVKSHVNLDFSKIEIGLYTKQGSLKEKTECAPTNGYYFLPLYEKGDYVLKVHPPPGWSFEPAEVAIAVDGVTDQCSTGQDVNFAFNGFGITGKVVTLGQSQGPSGISVQLVGENGEKRETTTNVGGDFHFTPVIPGKYTVKASHPRWKLDPSTTMVQVTEGHTALPAGSLAVKGYDVQGSVFSNGSPVPGVHVLLYSKVDNPKLRVEGCTTALLQGVPESPICYSVTDANGVYTFGLVPAGDYYLLPLTKQPGQSRISFNVKPDRADLNVQHNSLFMKNAFEVTGFTVVGSVVSQVGGKGLAGVRVSLDGHPVGVTDASGKYTLPSVQPSTYTLAFAAEQCEFSDTQLVISNSGVVTLAEVLPARWRVCGSVASGEVTAVHTVTIQPERANQASITAKSDPTLDGKWCTFLQPGVYMASVAVTEQERRDGLQFFPLNQKIQVSRLPVDGIVFSQLKAKLTGSVRCKNNEPACDNLEVTLRPLSPDGTYMGQPSVTKCKGGSYTFEEVLPGSVEVSVPAVRLCWGETRHNVAVTAAQAAVPDFTHTGYSVTFSASHPTEVEYVTEGERGVLNLEAGVSQHCVASSGIYTFTPQGCHHFQPASSTYNTARDTHVVQINAVSHAVGVKVFSSEKVDDLVLKIDRDGQGGTQVGPITPRKDRDGSFVYEHTIHMAQGEVSVLSAHSSRLLFVPRDPQQLIGGSTCAPNALQLSAVRGLTLAGRLLPPVPGVTLTLSSDDLELTQVTGDDGGYSFGPLDASAEYRVVARKDSYVFVGPDAAGDITAHKLAEITVQVVDDADGHPLQGALVSVSGGQYRRNLATGADGRLGFPSLAPADYYVKPLMKEYRFSPPHKIVSVKEGNTYTLTLRGVRVAWSGMGTLVSLGGLGVGGASVVAAPQGGGRCAAEEAVTEANTGSFRVRGLSPQCTYVLQLKDSAAPELAGLRLANAPVHLKIEQVAKDIEGIRLIAIQPHQITDVNVLVYTPSIDHYKTLKLKLALETQPTSPVYSTKLDPVGYSQTLNPGLMYVLPRLPADNKTYLLQLESTLSKATHAYTEQSYYFNSDGRFKHFTIEFTPKVKASEQELSQTSLLVLPLLGLLGVMVVQRQRIITALGSLATELMARAPQPRAPAPRPTILDESQINQIVQNVNAVNRRVKPRKVQ